MSSFKVAPEKIKRIGELTARLYNNDSVLRYKYQNFSQIMMYLYDLTKINYASVNYQYNDSSNRREELKPVDEYLENICVNVTDKGMYRASLTRYDLLSLNNLLRGLNYQIELRYDDRILKDLFDSILRNLCYILTDEVEGESVDRWV